MPLAYSNRGFAKGRLKDYTGSIIDNDEAIRLDPKYFNAYLFRAYAKGELKDYTRRDS